MKSYREIEFIPYIAPCSYFRIYAHELPGSVASAVILGFLP